MGMTVEDIAFPTLTAEEIEQIQGFGERHTVPDGTVVFRAGESDIDLFIVESGALEIQNPNDGHRQIAVHKPGGFAGDIDLLTRRPVIVTAIARGETGLLQIPGCKVRKVLLRLPQISEKLLKAFQVRRHMLASLGNIGMIVTGPAECRLTNLIREFLDKNFVPYTWHRDENPVTGGPTVDCGDGKILDCPSLQELAQCAGVWQECPTEIVDLVIVGSGPAGMSAAVYAASEGISTLVLDGLGPGGQAASSSKIENFIGFPSGLSGTELATRAVIQMLKFGAQIVAPVHVKRLEKSTEPDGHHRLHLDCGAVVRARNVLIASGLAWRRLNALGTRRYEQAGIYYACTTTESILHEGEPVAVVGAGNSAGQAAMFLADHRANIVHILMRGNDLHASMSNYLIERIQATPNIRVHKNVEVTRLIEDGKLRGVEVTQPDDTQYSIEIGALYVFIGAEPQIDWLPEEIARDEKGFLLTGADAADSELWPLTERTPCPLETTIPHVFAAGDVRSGSTKRVGFAVGDGALAVACVHALEPSSSSATAKH